MTGGRRAALLGGGAAVALVGIAAFLVWQISDDGTAYSGAAVARASPATAPFTGLTDGTIRVGDTGLRVVVADDIGERLQGLRGRRDASPYDGMLFVFPSESTPVFTMSGVPAALDIAFYGADGREVDRLEMQPCSGTDAACPSYLARAPFRYALETGAGKLPPARSPCGRRDVSVTPAA